MKKFSGADVQVTKEDQKNINTFSKLYTRQKELSEKRKALEEKKNQHKDTLDQIEINDDQDLLRYRFGSCFLELPTVQVRELVQKEIVTISDEQHTLAKESEDNSKKLKRLKATLYSKFGNSINLEQ